MKIPDDVSVGFSGVDNPPIKGRQASAELRYLKVKLDDGRTVSLFVNKSNNLVVLDVVDADEKGGIEVYRKTI